MRCHKFVLTNLALSIIYEERSAHVNFASAGEMSLIHLSGFRGCVNKGSGSSLAWDNLAKWAIKNTKQNQGKKGGEGEWVRENEM